MCVWGGERQECVRSKSKQRKGESENEKARAKTRKKKRRSRGWPKCGQIMAAVKAARTLGGEGWREAEAAERGGEGWGGRGVKRQVKYVAVQMSGHVSGDSAVW